MTTKSAACASDAVAVISLKECFMDTALGAFILRHKGRMTTKAKETIIAQSYDLAMRMFAKARPDYALQFSNELAEVRKQNRLRLKPFVTEMKIDEPKTKAKKSPRKKKRKTTKAKTS